MTTCHQIWGERKNLVFLTTKKSPKSIQGLKSEEAFGGFLKWWVFPPIFIHFKRVFHYFHHPFWGFFPLFFGNHHFIFRDLWKGFAGHITIDFLLGDERESLMRMEQDDQIILRKLVGSFMVIFIHPMGSKKIRKHKSPKKDPKSKELPVSNVAHYICQM